MKRVPVKDDSDTSLSTAASRSHRMDSVDSSYGIAQTNFNMGPDHYFELSQNKKDELALRMCKDLTDDKLDVTESDLDILVNRIGDLSAEESERIIQNSLQTHVDDPNFPRDNLTMLEKLIDPNDSQKNRVHNLKVQAALIQHHAPYTEVRSISDPTDDPTELAETFRAYLLGSLWVIISTGVNQFFEPRQPPIAVYPSLLQLLVYPCGRALEYLPDWRVKIGKKEFSLNPGPWSYKEQTLATVMFGITGQLAYVDNQIFVQKLKMFYNNTWATAGYQLMLILSTQFVGFGLAGLMPSVLIYPIERIWPTNFPTLALNRALLKPEPTNLAANGWTISRYRFFVYCFIGMFAYFWLPTYLFSALSNFNWMTWIDPKNFNLAAITGSVSGLGINPIPTFDWNVIDSMVPPLYTPWFANLSTFVGCLFAGAVVIPAVYWKNMYNTAYLPINSNTVFDNTGQSYAVKEILSNGVIDKEKYEKYSPPFYTAANLVVYGAYFALYPALIVDAGLSHWREIKKAGIDIWRMIRNQGRMISSFDDAHCKMMQAYKEVPLYWYLIVLVISLVLGIVCVEVYPTETPVWGIFFALGLSLVFIIPVGLVASTTGLMINLNVLAELIAGYAVAGKGVAMMNIKAFGLNTNVQAISFLSNQKLAHYAKLPPRATFKAQILGTLIQAFVIIGVVNWQISNYPDICTPDQPNKFTCPTETTYFSASIIWGVIGPKRVFVSMYPVLQYCFLIGAVIPLPFWLIKKYRPKSLLRIINPLIVLFGMVSYAPYNLTYYTPALYVGALFNLYIRKRYKMWFERYTFVLASGFSAGIALCAIIIFFAVQYHPKPLNWWGNNVVYNGVDGGLYQQALKEIPEKGYFGPEPGSFAW